MTRDDSTRLPVNTKVLIDFFSRVRIDPAVSFNGVPCWIWTGHISKDGYAKFTYNHRAEGAHRLAYEMFVEIIKPRSNQGDHLCRNRACANPVHVEAVTSRVNTLRGNAKSSINARKTHCHRGHEFTPKNTRRYGPDNRFRECRACRKIFSTERWRKLHPARTHCRNGHPYTTPVGSAGIHRCLVCRQVQVDKRRERRRQLRIS